MTTQYIIVAAIIAIAVGYVAYKIYETFSNTNSSCGGCKGCSMNPQQQKNEPISNKKPSCSHKMQKTFGITDYYLYLCIALNKRVPWPIGQVTVCKTVQGSSTLPGTSIKTGQFFKEQSRFFSNKWLYLLPFVNLQNGKNLYCTMKRVHCIIFPKIKKNKKRIRLHAPS